MIKKLAWNTFKNTGDINTFMEFRQVKNIEEIIKEQENEKSKSKWNHHC